MILKDQRVVVTGGLGSLGLAVIQAAKAAGAEVAAIVFTAVGQEDVIHHGRSAV